VGYTKTKGKHADNGENSQYGSFGSIKGRVGHLSFVRISNCIIKSTTSLFGKSPKFTPKKENNTTIYNGYSQGERINTQNQQKRLNNLYAIQQDSKKPHRCRPKLDQIPETPQGNHKKEDNNQVTQTKDIENA